MCKSVMICLAILAAATTVLAQNQQPETPKTCAAATGLDFYNTQFEGYWQEVARNPAANVSCISVNVAFWNNTSNNTYMLVNVSHSSSVQSLYMDVNEKANITLTSPAPQSYDVSFVNGQQQKTVTIKLLEFVNSTYLLGCSYTNENDVSTSAGFILARGNYTLNNTAIANNDASQRYTNFVNGTVNNVSQYGCYASSAGKSLPLITGFLALALLLIKA